MISFCTYANDFPNQTLIEIWEVQDLIHWLRLFLVETVKINK